KVRSEESKSKAALDLNMAVIPEITVGSCDKPMPIIGMGTSPHPPLDLETAKAAILEAITAGYRHFDTAFGYQTEEHLAAAVPEAIRLGLIKSRDDLFITTKLFGIFADRDQVVPAIKMSLHSLLKKIVSVEMNPLWQQKELREFCKKNGIHVSAYSPLGASGTSWGDNRIFECDVLKKIAKAKGKTTAQVSLRWVYEQEVSLIVKSYNKERMRENLQIFDWSLTEEESSLISQLPQRKGFTFASIFGNHDVVLELDAGI
ncbi:hypothetical protein RJ639_029875, partial [Escallonia herrerae]